MVTFHRPVLLTIVENLVLAGVSFSLRKGAKKKVIDSETKTEVLLFHLRLDKWNDHFEWVGVLLVGSTATGRATVEGLKMNRRVISAITEGEVLLGRHPF